MMNVIRATTVLVLVVLLVAGVRAQTGAPNRVDNAGFSDGLNGWENRYVGIATDDHGNYAQMNQTGSFLAQDVSIPDTYDKWNCDFSARTRGAININVITSSETTYLEGRGADWGIVWQDNISVSGGTDVRLEFRNTALPTNGYGVDNVTLMCTVDSSDDDGGGGPPDHCVTGYAALAPFATTSEIVEPGGVLYATGFSGRVRLVGYSDSGGGGVTYPDPKPRIHAGDVPSSDPYSLYQQWSRLSGSATDTRTWTFIGPDDVGVDPDTLFFVNCAAEPDATPTPTAETTETPTEEPTPEYPGWWDACLVAEAVPRTFSYRAGWMPAGTYYVVDVPAIYPHSKMPWEDHYCSETGDQAGFSVLTFDFNTSGWHFRVRSGHVSHAMTSGSANNTCTGAGGNYQAVLYDPADGWKTLPYGWGIVYFSPVPFRMEFCPPTVNINETPTPTNTTDPSTPTPTEHPTNWVTFTPTITPTLEPTPTATITGTGDYPSCPPLNCVSYDSYNISSYPSTTAVTMTNGDDFRICGADAYYGTERYLPGDRVYVWNNASQTINWWTVAEPARIDICRDIIPVPTPVPTVPPVPTLPPGTTATPAGGGDDCFSCDICQILSDILIAEIRNLEDNRTAIALLETIAATATDVPTATPPETNTPVPTATDVPTATPPETATAIGELQTIIALEQTRDAFPTPTETPDGGGPTATAAGGSVPTIQCVTTTAMLDSPFPTANLTALPDMSINLPTLRPIWTPMPTLAITSVEVLNSAETMIAQVQTPLSAVVLASGSYSTTTGDTPYSYQSGTEMAATVTTPMSSTLDWAAIINPANDGWTTPGTPMWAMAPLVRPFLIIIWIVFIFLVVKFVLAMGKLLSWILEWIVRVIELIPGE